jgi:hypothetical protein
MMRVLWSSGKTTDHHCRSWQRAYDVVGGEALPFERWEMWA